MLVAIVSFGVNGTVILRSLYREKKRVK